MEPKILWMFPKIFRAIFPSMTKPNMENSPNYLLSVTPDPQEHQEVILR